MTQDIQKLAEEVLRLHNDALCEQTGAPYYARAIYDEAARTSAPALARAVREMAATLEQARRFIQAQEQTVARTLLLHMIDAAIINPGPTPPGDSHGE
jgi:hypothetical protein